MKISQERLKQVEKIRDLFWKVLFTLKPFKLNERGQILFDEWPYILLDALAFYEISEEIKKMVGPIQSKIWYEFGKESGKDIAVKVRKRFEKAGLMDVVKIELKAKLSLEELKLLADKSLEALLNKFWGYGLYAGWLGRVEMIKFDPEKEIVIRAKKQFEAYGYKKRGIKLTSAGCNFLRGVAAGLFSALIGKEFEAEEVKCVAKGDEFCEMRIYRVENED